MTTFLSTQNDKLYDCIYCKYTTVIKGNFLRHQMTSKHILATKKDKKDKNNICKICNKVYKDRSGLWRHSQSCIAFVEHDSALTNTNQIDPNPVVINTIIEVVKQNNEFKELLAEQTKQNNEFKDLIIEQNKQIIELSSKPTTTNNNFNLKSFLNEKCKDAINLNNFVKQIQISNKDLDETNEIGYVDGITKIFINNLEELEITQRPVHCSDTKRESVYIRHDNQWEKENFSNLKLTNAIGHIVKLLKNFEIQRRDYTSFVFKPSLFDVSEVTNSVIMDWTTREESRKYYKQIARNIMRETIILK